MINTVIFDFDGVIHNTLDTNYNIRKKLDSELTLEKYKDFFNGNFYANYEAHKTSNTDATNKFFNLQGEEYNKLKIDKDVKKELLKISNKYRLFIISSCQGSTMKRYLDSNGLGTIFEEILGVEVHKSKVEKFKMLFERYRFEDRNCVFITDTLGDILEARKVGVRSIAVDFGYHDRKRLEQGKPLIILSKFSDILPTIEKISE